MTVLEFYILLSRSYFFSKDLQIHIFTRDLFIYFGKCLTTYFSDIKKIFRSLE